jgi:hypothetical protein
MRSRVVCSPYHVCCVVCGRIVPTREARMMDLCGPVYFCSRCPDPDLGWPNVPAPAAKASHQSRSHRAARSVPPAAAPSREPGTAAPRAGRGHRARSRIASIGTRHRRTVRAVLAVAVLTVALYAAPPVDVLAAGVVPGSPAGQASVQAQAEGSPTLRCAAHAVPVLDPTVAMVAVTCSVADAAAEDSSFRLTATLDEQSGDRRTVDPFCIAPLDDGRGQCGRRMTRPGGAGRARLSITATLRPSGRTLSSTVALEGSGN